MGAKEIDKAITNLVAGGHSFTVAELVQLTGLSRQALAHHLSRWLESDRLRRIGRGRATRYEAHLERSFDARFPIEGLEEHLAHADLVRWLDEAEVPLSDSSANILAYVVTELVNNAIDHSSAPWVRIVWGVQGSRMEGRIHDEGVGALEHLKRGLALESTLHALQELSKGKTTTDPDRHTGEGIFFSSKMVDRFELHTSGLIWIVDNELGEDALLQGDLFPGTDLRITLSLDRTPTAEEIFRRYTHDFEFDTTRCVIRLFEYGTRFASRSEARRLLHRLEEFQHVILDFTGVAGVGQGFVDEVFRVWARNHPEVELVVVGANEVVEFMIRRGRPRG